MCLLWQWEHWTLSTAHNQHLRWSLSLYFMSCLFCRDMAEIKMLSKIQKLLLTQKRQPVAVLHCLILGHNVKLNKGRYDTAHLLSLFTLHCKHIYLKLTSLLLNQPTALEANVLGWFCDPYETNTRYSLTSWPHSTQITWQKQPHTCKQTGLRHLRSRPSWILWSTHKLILRVNTYSS